MTLFRKTPSNINTDGRHGTHTRIWLVSSKPATANDSNDEQWTIWHRMGQTWLNWRAKPVLYTHIQQKNRENFQTAAPSYPTFSSTLSHNSTFEVLNSMIHILCIHALTQLTYGYYLFSSLKYYFIKLSHLVEYKCIWIVKCGGAIYHIWNTWYLYTTPTHAHAHTRPSPKTWTHKRTNNRKAYISYEWESAHSHISGELCYLI